MSSTPSSRQPYPLHALSNNFSWQPATSRVGAVTDAQLAGYNNQGYFRLDNAFDAGELGSLLAAIDPLEAETEAYLRTQPNGAKGISRAEEITFRPHLVSRSAVARAFSLHRVLVDLVTDLVGADAHLYWDQLVYKKPGTKEEFPWHQDNGYTFVLPQQYLTCWIALTTATVDNGCPWVAPGLHKLGTLAHTLTPLGYQCFDTPNNAVPVELEAGSIAVFSSLTPHRTGPNLTDSTRKAYILQYAPQGARAYPAFESDARKRAEGMLCDAPDRQYAIASVED